ncbi:glycosyltransferase family 2 protein [Candidatus Uhrbacteria bacterium]|nr:glycosyltransferase family 2 protein [Candidatus Uhrbacteria bacterium]
MISVVIPVFNQAARIAATLDSLFSQTYGDFEVIIVDDGSTDGLSVVLDGYFSSRRPARRVVRIVQENRGAPSARNRGVREANGDFLFFCDADAVLVPQALEVMLAELTAHPEASYVYPSFYWGFKLFRFGPFSADRLRRQPCNHTMSLMRRQAFPADGWDERVRRLQDWDLWLTLLESGHVGRWIDRPLFTAQPGVISSGWFPKIVYRLFPFLPVVRRYNRAVAAIKRKHHLN